jgi:ATP-binding cassette, subfamily B, multidrug efflux pump
MSENREPPRTLTDRGPIGGPGRPPDAGPIGFGKPKYLKNTVRRIFGYIGQSKLLVFIVTVCLIISSVATLASSYFLKPLINNYILPGNFRGLAIALVALGGIYAAGIIASYFQQRISVKIAQRTVNLIRQDLFNKMQDLELSYFDRHTHGELMSHYTNDVENVQMMLEQSLTQLISGTIVFIGSIVVMIILSPILFAIITILLVLMTIISTKIGSKSRIHFMNQQNLLGQLNGHIEESITGLREIKVFNHENNTGKTFNDLNEKYRVSSSRASFLAGIVMPITVNLNNIAYAAVAVFGGILTLLKMFDIGSLAAFLQYSRQIGQPVSMITSQFTNILAAMAGAERIFEVMDQSPEINEGKVVLVPVKQDVNSKLQSTQKQNGNDTWAWQIPGKNQLIPLKGDIRFDNVTFSYIPQKTVLRDISLYAKPGQVIAFVGSTGAGKTTITNLVNRFYDVGNGSITYDGIDIKNINKDSLRHSLGMVLQDTHLFTGTVLENIRYGRLDASDDECIIAAKAASAHSFISRLPQGYQTIISGDGANLSQGQKQLIAIARAYISDPTVMILDEATSSIDTRTERLVQKGMNTLMQGRTVLVIAHRLSTVRNANAIMVLENGKIIERGDHTNLLTQKGRYYELCTGITELD